MGWVPVGLVRVPYAEQMLVPLPDGVDPAAAASVSDNIVDAWRTVAPYLAEDPGRLGAGGGGGGPGSIGLYASAIAVAMGAPRVVYVDTDERRLSIAREVGAEAVAGLPDERLGPFPITVDASADPAGLALAVGSTGLDGVCTSTGIYFTNDTPMPMFEAYVSGITFRTGRVHARPAMPAALELIAAGRFHPELVTTRRAAGRRHPRHSPKGSS